MSAPAFLYTHGIRHTHGFGFFQRGQRKFERLQMEAGDFIPGANMPVWRVTMTEDWARTQPKPWDDLLFHNLTDPGQNCNQAADYPEVVTRLEAALGTYLRRIQAPAEQWKRLGLEGQG